MFASNQQMHTGQFQQQIHWQVVYYQQIYGVLLVVITWYIVYQLQQHMNNRLNIACQVVAVQYKLCLVKTQHLLVILLLFYIGAPSKPGQPEVVKTGKNHCDLRWAPPRSDGGTRIKGYDVEVRDYPDGLWVIFYITLFMALVIWHISIFTNH